MLEKLIQSDGPPVLCLEVNPPHGVILDSIFKRLSDLPDGLDYFNITDSALARMKMAAIPFAAMLKDRFEIEPLVNVSCRDRNLIALQGDLLAAWTAGIQSVVALTGDAMSVGDSPEGKGVFEINSVGLLNTISKLNSGIDISGKKLNGAPYIVPGVVVNPNARNMAAELRRLEKKKQAGAMYALSQPVYDADSAVEFFTEVKKIGISTLVGLMPFKNAESALRVLDSVPGIRFSEKIEAELRTRDQKEDLSQFFIENALEMSEQLQPHVRGFHLICGTTPKLAIKLLKRLVEHYR
ncbi:MAG: methylenetetrahydrofolate reductase [Deltaproteobacteria bacterium]|nr:methylenetetrahydrofolate reductase [Deltaproteobacteria bacterium]